MTYVYNNVKIQDYLCLDIKSIFLFIAYSLNLLNTIVKIE